MVPGWGQQGTSTFLSTSAVSSSWRVVVHCKAQPWPCSSSVKRSHSFCGSVWNTVLMFLDRLLTLPFWREQSVCNEGILRTPSPNSHRTLPCTVSCHQESQSASSLLVGSVHGSLTELPPPAGEQVSVLKLAY